MNNNIFCLFKKIFQEHIFFKRNFADKFGKKKQNIFAFRSVKIVSAPIKYYSGFPDQMIIVMPLTMICEKNVFV